MAAGHDIDKVHTAVVEDGGSFYAVAQAQLEDGLRLVLKSQALPERSEALERLPVVGARLVKLMGPQCIGTDVAVAPATSEAVKDALEQIDDLVDRAGNLPDRARYFADGVTETLEDMAKWINENQHVTEKQLTAIENIGAGIGKWEERA